MDAAKPIGETEREAIIRFARFIRSKSVSLAHELPRPWTRRASRSSMVLVRRTRSPTVLGGNWIALSSRCRSGCDPCRARLKQIFRGVAPLHTREVPVQTVVPPLESSVMKRLSTKYTTVV